MSKFKIIKHESGDKWYIQETGTHQYIYENGGYKAYNGLDGLFFKTRKKAREALNKFLGKNRKATIECENTSKVEFEIGFVNSVEWYAFDKKRENYYLFNDGILRDWHNATNKEKENVYFRSRSEALVATQKYNKTTKKPKLAPSAKKKVNDIVVKLTATLKNLEDALKVLTVEPIIITRE